MPQAGQVAKFFARAQREDEGQDLAEYALLLALICLICVAGVTALGVRIGGQWGSVLSDLAAAL